jgi:hypothetical protein
MMQRKITIEGAGKGAGAWVGGLIPFLFVWLAFLFGGGPLEALAAARYNPNGFLLFEALAAARDDPEGFFLFAVLSATALAFGIVWGILVGWLAVKVSEAFEQRSAAVLAGSAVGALSGFGAGGLIALFWYGPGRLIMLFSPSPQEFSPALGTPLTALWIFVLILSLLIGSVSVIRETQEHMIWICTRCGYQVHPDTSICSNCHRALQ